MQLDELLGHRKAKTRAAVLARCGTIGLLKRLEDSRLCLRGNADTCILHVDEDAIATHLGAHADAAFARELDGVANEVRKNLLQSVFVRTHRQRFIDLRHHAQVFVCCEGRERLQREVDHARQSQWPLFQRNGVFAEL